MILTAARVGVFTESVIREMTRLAMEHGAINLAQGFPDFPAPADLLAAASRALADKKCAPCEGGSAPLSEGQARTLRSELHPDWRLGPDAKSLQRALKFRDFYRTMSFVNALAHIANVEDHHPDLEVGYNYCNVTFSTHSIGGLSENDFICAAKLDRL